MVKKYTWNSMLYSSHARFVELFIIFALKLKLFDNMAQLNRIKLVLLNKEKLVSGLQKN